MSANRDLNNSASVFPFEYEPDGKAIWPCTECHPWHVEVVVNEVEGVRIREWHAIGCSALKDVDV